MPPSSSRRSYTRGRLSIAPLLALALLALLALASQPGGWRPAELHLLLGRRRSDVPPVNGEYESREETSVIVTHNTTVTFGESSEYSKQEEDNPLPSTTHSPRKRCATWSPLTKMRYHALCAPWSEEIALWTEEIRRRRRSEDRLESVGITAAYACDRGAGVGDYCAGFGDRLAGMFSVFTYAVTYRVPYRNEWTEVAPILQTCVLEDEVFHQVRDEEELSLVRTVSAEEIRSGAHTSSYCEPLYGNRWATCRTMMVSSNCTTTAHETIPYANASAESEEENHGEDEMSTTTGYNSSIGSPRRSSQTLGEEKPLVVTFRGYQRACTPRGMCTKMHDRLQTPLTAAHIFGCAMRAMFEPTLAFLEGVRVPLVSEGRVEIHSVREIEEIFRKYYIIGIHFREGDAFTGFFPDSTGGAAKLRAAHEGFDVPFRCALTIESHLGGGVEAPADDNSTLHTGEVSEGNKTREDSWSDEETFGTPDERLDGGEILVRGKPVRWFVASDSSRFRAFAKNRYGSRVMMLDLSPQHIAKAGEERATGAPNSTLGLTLAEWYVLGLVNKIILNHVSRRSMYVGRLSAFAKTAWVYQLKSKYYDAGTCEERTLPFDGNWEHVGQECNQNSLFKRQEMKLPGATFFQPHLSVLKRRGLKFPNAWMMGSLVCRTNSPITAFGHDTTLGSRASGKSGRRMKSESGKAYVCRH